MLRELRIENLLLIERAELRLGPGLNVITGETGAGKTVLAHSLDLLMGGKPRNAMVRPGAEEAWVEGTFDLPGGLTGEDDPAMAEILERMPVGAEEVTLGRRVSAAGRSSAFIAGRAASAADLARLGGELLAFYGQHQHRKLTIASAQMDILDGYGGPKALKLREQVAAGHRRRMSLSRELEELRNADGRRERDLDLLRFELEEIDEIAPRLDEKAELERERARLRGMDELRAALVAAVENLDGGENVPGAMAAAHHAASAVERAAEHDGGLDSLAERTRTLAVEIDDLASELRSELSHLEADPERLEQVEHRLAELDRLERKHGGSIEAVLNHARACREAIATLEAGESREQELSDALRTAEGELVRLAAKLTAVRKRAKSELERHTAAELAELAMPGATLTVDLQVEKKGPGPHGAERPELMLAANPGMAAAPLREAASGGELSRVMLALTSLVESETRRTAVFDEIDAGVGGETAVAVGEKLRRLADASGQVIVITHLPQVASQAAVHLRVTRQEGRSPATAIVERLAGEEIVAEIRRMLGAGEGDDAATRHARELVGGARTG